MGVGTQRRNRDEAERLAKATAPEVAAPAAEQQKPSNDPPKVKEPSFEDLQKEAESRGIDHKALKLNSKKKVADAIAEFDEAKKAAGENPAPPADEEQPSTPPTDGDQNPPDDGTDGGATPTE